jgi:ATP-dependent Clp protease ATP-binding subunit ClpC
MPGNLTPRAQRVLVMAKKEAVYLSVPFIGTEHVLMGISLLGAGVAANVLNKIGLQLEIIQAEVEGLAAREPKKKWGEAVHFSPLAGAQMMSFAWQEAKELNHTYIGTEHLLLALLRQTEGGAVEILKKRNINPEEVRAEIIKELNPVYIPHVPSEKGGVPSKGETAGLPASGAPAEGPAGGGMSIPIRQRREPVDVRVRYDIYCAERDGKMVVYRNAQFKGIKTLGHHDSPFTDFVELERANGQAVFVARASVVKFCEHGAAPEAEGVE